VRWRRDSREDPVSVNARLARLPSNDLLDVAESSLGEAGRELTHSRYSGSELGTEQFHLERSHAAAQQALQAIEVLVSRRVVS
jgi:hypothetical protein